ncbi:hypothetical protein C4K04_0821 [Pseudomonas chlororaphis]|uniref:Uncharacterized protein n=1 Tax=Pseudomonas chlororaphis TaxID=587753 RepID=A0A3G7TJX6_9PSED|nr:hypothetical protein C4K04_0821 [Pseudomonas chlororaphis]
MVFQPKNKTDINDENQKDKTQVQITPAHQTSSTNQALSVYRKCLFCG